MSVKKVKGGYRVESSVGGYPFRRTYLGFNRGEALSEHKKMERIANRYGDKWIDKELFFEYE